MTANDVGKARRFSFFNWASDAKKFFQILKSGGYGAALKRSAHVLTWRLHTFIDRKYDRNRNVETSSHAFSKDLNFRSEGDDIGHEEPMYLPTSSLAFANIMANLRIPYEEFVFIDFGSGKGRTLFLASEYNFKRIIGVEFAQELHDTEKRNIDNYSNAKQRCFDITSQLVDATIFDIPNEKCVFYFFNPFEEEVMRKVLQRIADSYRDNPRKMYFIYYKPKFPELFAALDFSIRLRPSRRRLTVPNPYGLLIFETRQP